VLQDDLIRLGHIVTAASDVIAFASQGSRQHLDSDPMFRRAVLHAIQEIGEAAGRLTDETRALMPEIPWAAVKRTRNIVVHVYHSVDHDRIWTVVTDQVPVLLETVTALVSRATARAGD
jgi:uncharacterized protein with HEPN domain